jgi:3-hydroxyisobutyrate dehydrogenase-like beta-hydroxyacid dehydrogenase
VKNILFGTNAVIESGNHNLIVADISTISPSQSEYCAQRLRNAGIEMLGIPVMGGPAAAETGDLVPIVAGSKQAFEKVRQVIEKLGRTFYVGERDGSANAIKLALNLNIALVASAVSEGITLVRRSEDGEKRLFTDISSQKYAKRFRACHQYRAGNRHNTSPNCSCPADIPCSKQHGFFRSGLYFHLCIFGKDKRIGEPMKLDMCMY